MPPWPSTTTTTTFSSENEIEKWHLRQSAKAVPLFNTGEVRTAYFLLSDGSGGVESITVSTLHGYYAGNLYLIDLAILINFLSPLFLWRHNVTFHFHFLKRWVVWLIFFLYLQPSKISKNRILKFLVYTAIIDGYPYILLTANKRWVCF